MLSWGSRAFGFWAANWSNVYGSWGDGVALLSKVCRQRYLNGSPELLARNVLADNNTGELFVGPSVHPENYRAIVAALRQPGWFRHYQGHSMFWGCSRCG